MEAASLLLATNIDQDGYNIVSKLLSEWTPSQAAIELIKLNGVTDEQIARSVDYLKNQTELNDIDDVDGYDNWNTFFIMFCVKANRKNDV